MTTKKIFPILLFLLLFISPFHHVFAEQINDFSVDITVHKDSSLTVIETIKYTFDEVPRHGIYRSIPYKYSRRGATNYNLRMQILSVTDQKGNPWGC